MTTEEAKQRIREELIDGFREWLRDEAELDDMAYGKKYGWCKSQTRHTEDLKSFLVYREYFFTGRYLPYWERAGYPRSVIWALHDEKWLSYKLYSNWKSRAAGRTDWFYISQKLAREIWKSATA